MAKLQITRKRSLLTYLEKIERLSMHQGFSNVLVFSVRWNRLQFCIDSIKLHILQNVHLVTNDIYNQF